MLQDVILCDRGGDQKSPLFFVFLIVALSFDASNTSSELHVFRHDCNALRVDGAQVRISKETHKISFSGLLQREDRRALKPQSGLVVLTDLSNKPLERQLADKQITGFLEPSYLTESDCSWPVTVGLFYAIEIRCVFPGRRACLAGRSESQVLAGGLASR